MNVSRHHSISKEWAQYVLLCLPTTFLMAFGIYLANHWLPALQQQWVLQSASFGLGLFSSIFLFARRLRFISLTLLFVMLCIAGLTLIEYFLVGEFAAFFAKAKMYPFLFLFGSGWLAGYGFSRSRLVTAVWVVLVFSLLILVIASIGPPDKKLLVWYSSPILAYMAYILYTSELLRKINEYQTGFGRFMLKRFAGFTLLSGLLLATALWLLRADFLKIEKDWETGGVPKENNERKNSLTRNDGLGTTTQPTMGLSGSNNRNQKDSLLFVAKLDHYFADEITPNPLYFVSDYYTRFDTVAQAFSTDTLRPNNDLLQPNIEQLGLYFTYEDSAVLRNALAQNALTEVTAEVYRAGLSPRHFTAPITAFFVQPISVPEADRSRYKSAYRVRMQVSELNSAYFVYNPSGDEFLSFFQEQRFAVLRSITDFAEAPQDFLAYYTQMPKGTAYDSIIKLSQQIVSQSGAQTPIDKVIAIRNFFLEKDSTGQPIFRYSDNPGIPGIPGANKLCYFLFDSKKGYCAYYAGATLFLLRALGIPSRIATGFLTVDRSQKNPGWYWFYEDQAHAWVQVWFPGFGWLDFDTTVPSNETQEAPQPDQTPPLTTQTAWWVANGKVETIDTREKRLTMQVRELLFRDVPVELPTPRQIELDISMARFLNDTGNANLQSIKRDMEIVAVSFSDLFKPIKAGPKETWNSLVKKWPTPIPADEIKLMITQKEKPFENKVSRTLNISLTKLGITIALVFAIAGLLLILLPTAVYTWFSFQAKNQHNIYKQSYYNYMATMLYLHQVGFKRGANTPLAFAETRVDPAFQTNLGTFLKSYQKLKYSPHALHNHEKELLTTHHAEMKKMMKGKITAKQRLISFLNPAATLGFFTQPNILGPAK